MKRTASLGLILIAACGISLAQTVPAPGWRRAAEPAPVQDPAGPPAPQDPNQPVARADEFGQIQPTQASRMPEPQRLEAPPPPSYGLPPQLTIPAGSFVTIRVNQELSSNQNQEGDFFSAILVQPVVVDGVVLAQRGQTVTGRVAEAKKSGRVSGVSRLGLQLTSLTLADGSQAAIQSQLVTRDGRTNVGSDVAAVGTTTAVGAAIGAAADWGRGAAIGAGAGAAAGIIGVLLTRGHETVVYPETALTFRLDTPVTVNLARAPQAYRYVGPNEYDHPVDAQLARRPPPQRNVWYGGPSLWGYPYGYGYPYGGYYPYYGGVGVGVVIRGGGGYRRYGRR
jgi:hypothetical protein